MSTKQLAEWISTLDFDHLAPSVVEAAVRSFQNSLGCIIGGASHPTVQRAIKAFSPLASINQRQSCILLGQSTVWVQTKVPDAPAVSKSDVQSVCTDISNAALINGIASHVHDYDDTHLHTVIHPAGAVVVSLLAYAQHLKVQVGRTVSGKDFITALVAGIETGLRLGNSVSPKHYSAGWHVTGTVSPIAVAAALANLLHLPSEETIHALGIASTQPVGIRVHFGTDTKPLHVGRAAQNGIMSTQLAQAGFTAATDAIEGRRGWIEVLGYGADTVKEQVNELLEYSALDKKGFGQRRVWETEKNTFKPFPCGIVIHPTIDACVQLHQELNLHDKTNLENLMSIRLKVHPLVLDLTGKKKPQNGLEAKFSVYHGAAIGLVLASATPSEYEDNVVTDPQVIKIRDMVVAEVDENMKSDEATVTITMIDGMEKSKHVEHAVGSLSKPMTDAQLTEKFLKQTEQVIGKDRAKSINEMAWNIISFDDVSRLVETGR